MRPRLMRPSLRVTKLPTDRQLARSARGQLAGGTGEMGGSIALHSPGGWFTKLSAKSSKTGIELVRVHTRSNALISTYPWERTVAIVFRIAE
jgi:hypothetical protein